MIKRTNNIGDRMDARTQDNSAPDSFSPSEAWRLVEDLARPRPAIYWADFLLSTAVGYGLASIYFLSPPFSLVGVVSFLVGGLALFRTGSMIHEIVHMRRGAMLGFRTTWNLVCGVPMLMPSFLYENHADHHKHHHYGTKHDGEYLPLGAGPLGQVAAFFGQSLLLPLLVAVRFLVLTPVSFLHPKLRTWVLERYSSYVINFHYRREIPAQAPRRIWALLDFACFLRTAAIFVFIAAGWNHWTRIPQLYALAVFVLGLNYVRNLTAHRYRNNGKPMSYVDQLIDSVTITGSPLLTELFFPLGLRYHALHHLFPALPYHNLGAAHRRLMESLPADSPYHRTVVPSYWTAVRQLIGDARAASRLEPRPPHWRRRPSESNVGAESAAR